MKNIAEIRKEYRISNAWLAKVFGYKNVSSYNKSAGKKSIENGVVELVNIIDSDNAEKKSDRKR